MCSEMWLEIMQNSFPLGLMIDGLCVGHGRGSVKDAIQFSGSGN